MAQPGPKTKLLIQVLSRLIADLDSESESHWRTWIQRDLDSIRNSDYSGIEHFLAAFGGMGSFSDVSLASAEKNEKFSENRSKAYSLALEIKREVEGAT